MGRPYKKYLKLIPGTRAKSNELVMSNFKVTMKLTCGPVTDYIGGVKSYTSEGKTTEYIQKNIVLNAVYGKPEDNNFANATPSGKLEFSLSNPSSDIFVPGKQYKITLEEWD